MAGGYWDKKMPVQAVLRLIDNSLDYPAAKAYAAILGANPSKGARSPLLWNAAFAAHGVDAEMLALDIPADLLDAALEALEADSAFIGGAIAVPHKETTAAWLGTDRLTTEAAAIGAVNCLFRTDNGRLGGTNTDGEGAVKSMTAAFGDLTGSKALLIGLGGAGKAVASYLAGAIGQTGSLTVVNRHRDKADAFAARIDARVGEWPVTKTELACCGLLVNGTSVGAAPLLDQTALAPTGNGNLEASRGLVAAMPETAQVFDVVYQPATTALLEMATDRGLKILNGLEMNLIQAILGYGYAAPQPKGRDITAAAMKTAAAGA